MRYLSARALYVPHEYPTQQQVHFCFILVEAYYIHLQYDQSDIPQLGTSMCSGDINASELAVTFNPAFSSTLSPALQEYADGGEGGRLVEVYR